MEATVRDLGAVSDASMAVAASAGSASSDASSAVAALTGLALGGTGSASSVSGLLSPSVKANSVSLAGSGASSSIGGSAFGSLSAPLPVLTLKFFEQQRGSRAANVQHFLRDVTSEEELHEDMLARREICSWLGRIAMVLFLSRVVPGPGTEAFKIKISDSQDFVGAISETLRE